MQEKEDPFISKVLIPAYIPTEVPDLSHIQTPEATINEARELSIRLKNQAYSKSRDLLWSSSYKKEENPYETGLKLCIVKYGDELTRVSRVYNQYAFVEELQTLFYLTQELDEKVELADLNRFLRDLSAIMDDAENQYDCKHLCWEEIANLVTSNGGHVPHSLPLDSRISNSPASSSSF